MATGVLESSPAARRLVVLGVLVGLSLIPAVLLYLLFGSMSSATVERSGIKLGGPVAAFFVALWLLWRMYKEMRLVESSLETLLRPLVGNWRIDSASPDSGRKAVSSTAIAFQDGGLQIAGGTFFTAGADGARGAAIGDWSVEMAVADGRRLKYFYTLTDKLSTQSTWKGLVEVAADGGSAKTLEGTWQVLGKEHHSGTITLTKTG
jgi:hypothetical protein